MTMALTAFIADWRQQILVIFLGNYLSDGINFPTVSSLIMTAVVSASLGWNYDAGYVVFWAMKHYDYELFFTHGSSGLLWRLVMDLHSQLNLFSPGGLQGTGGLQGRGELVM
jgi:hypothetical protein